MNHEAVGSSCSSKRLTFFKRQETLAISLGDIALTEQLLARFWLSSNCTQKFRLKTAWSTDQSNASRIGGPTV